MTPKTIDFDEQAPKVADLIREHAGDGALEHKLEDTTLKDMLVEEYEESFLSAREYQVAVLEATGVPHDEIQKELGIRNRAKVREYSERAEEKKTRAEKTILIVEQSW